MRIVRCLTLHFLSIISLYNISISHGSNNINPHVIREPNNNANNSDSNNNENEDNIPNYIIYHAVEDDEDNELNDSAINDGYIGEEQQIKENDNSIINDGYLDNNFSDYSENNQNIDNNNINNITSNDMVIENSDNNIENNSENINRDNLYPGRVNVLNSMTFTKDNSHNRMQQTKFNSVPQENNEAIQVYTTHGMSNVNITGNLEVNDITDTQTLESNNMKKQTTKILNNNTNQISDNSTDNNTSYLGAIPVRVENNDNNISFGDNDNNFIIPNDEQTQDNNIPDNVNVGNSIEATQNNNINNNEKQYFNNNNFKGKVIINNKNAAVNNSTLQMDSEIIINEKNDNIEVNNITAYENTKIINNGNDTTFTASNVIPKGNNVIVKHDNDATGDDTIILKSNNNKSEVIEPRPAINNNNNNHNNNNSNETNYSTGKVNVTNTITLTNDNPGQTAQFKAVPSEAESVQVYKDTQANNINITGDYEVQDITEQQQLQSNEIKTAIENNSNETINDHPDSAIQNLRALNVNNNIESENDNIQNQNNNVRTNNILLRAGNINSNLDSENNNNSNTNNQQNDDNNAVARENNVILRAGNRAENSNNNVPIQQEEENNNELLREDNNTNLENNINNDTNNNNVINNENGIIPTIITETNNNQLQNYYGESFAIINNQQNYNIIHRITCNIKSNNDNNNDWKLESDHFNNDNFNESIYVQLNINGSDNNYKDINVPYVKYENFLTTDKGKQVYLVNNAPIETNNGTYRFVTNKKDLYLIKVTDSNKTQLGQAINDNGGYIDNGTLNTVLRGNNNNLNNNKNSNNNQNNDEKDADENEDPILYGFSGFRSSKPNNSEGEDDENNPNIFGSARPNNSDDEESTDSDYILGDSSNGALSVLLSNYLSPEDSNESSSQKSKLKSLKRKLIKNPASELSTYCANLKSMEYNNIDLMSQLFYDDFMYIFSPFSASKKAYFIRGELSGVNNSLWNSNNIFIGGDIFNDAILDCNSRLKLSLIGNTSFGKLTNNSYKYKFLEFNIGPKLSILSRDFVFELLGLYRYSNVSYIGDSSNQFVNSGFSIGSKLGVNINLSNIFVLQPYIKILYSNMTSYKPRKDLPSNYQINIVPGISLGLKLRNNFSIIAYYQHYYKSLLQDKNGLDLTDPSLNYINEFGIGLNKIFNNSVELSTKIAIDIINRLYNSKTKNDGSVKLQAQVSKLL